MVELHSTALLKRVWAATFIVIISSAVIPSLTAKTAEPYMPGRPTLKVEWPVATIIKMYGDQAPDWWRDFRGVVVEYNVVEETYPIPFLIFFDQASSVVPKRYRLFTEPESTRNFADTTIPGAAIPKYRHILNVLGFRLARNPELSIGLRPSYTKEKIVSLELEGTGGGKKLYDDDTPEGRILNRTVQVIIKYPHAFRYPWEVEEEERREQ